MPAPPADLQKLLTPDEVAKLVRSSPDHVRRLASAGVLKAVRLGDGPRARVRFKRDDVRRFLGGDVPAER
jgi:excisionase family DNA binding protein